MAIFIALAQLQGVFGLIVLGIAMIGSAVQGQSDATSDFALAGISCLLSAGITMAVTLSIMVLMSKLSDKKEVG